MNEHLSVEELLTALKFCNGYMGGSTCVGCPNAASDPDVNGLCGCRFDTTDEVIRLLETIVSKEA